MTDRPPMAGFVPFDVVPDPTIDPTLVRVVADLRRLVTDDPLRLHLLRLAEAFLARSDRSSGEIQLKSGARYKVDLSDRFAALMTAGYLPEAADLDLFCALVRPGATILDVGANFGLYAVEMGRLAGSKGSVFAFEPGPSSFSLLKSNVLANELDGSVRCIEAAAAAQPGTRAFYIAESSTFSGLGNTGRSAIRETIDVVCISLDTFDALAGRSVDLMKIDVEGAELEVLSGASALIDRSPELIVQFEFSKKNLDDAALEALLGWLDRRRESGYVVRFGAAEAIPGKELANAGELEKCRSGNLYLMRRGSQAEKRFQDALAATVEWHASQRAGAVDFRALIASVSDRLSAEMRLWRQTLDSSISPLKKDIESRIKALEAHEAKTLEIQTEVADRGRSLKVAERLILDLQTELSERANALNVTQARIASLSAKFTARGAALDAEHSRRVRSEKELQTEREQSDQLRQNAAGLERTLEERDAAIAKLESGIAQRDANLVGLRESVEHAEMRAREASLASERRIAELVERLNAEAAAHRDEIARVRAEFGWLVEKLKLQDRGR